MDDEVMNWMRVMTIEFINRKAFPCEAHAAKGFVRLVKLSAQCA
jgi:hypothetical protein